VKTRADSTSSKGEIASRDRLRDALGNAALEGIKPKTQAMKDLKSVINGTLTAEQYRQRVKARYGVQG
jgi:Antitoxin VbhA